MTKIINIVPTELIYQPDDTPYSETQQIAVESTGTEVVTFSGANANLSDITVSMSGPVPTGMSSPLPLGFNSIVTAPTAARIKMVNATKGVWVEHETTTTTKYGFFTIDVNGAMTTLAVRTLNTITGVDLQPIDGTHILMTYIDTDNGVKARIYEINVDEIINPGAALLLNASGAYNGAFQTHTRMVDEINNRVICGYDLTAMNTGRLRILEANTVTKVVTAYAEAATPGVSFNMRINLYDTTWGVGIGIRPTLPSSPPSTWIFEIAGTVVTIGNEILHTLPGNKLKYDVIPISATKYISLKWNNVDFIWSVIGRAGTVSAAINFEFAFNLTGSTADTYLTMAKTGTDELAVLVHEKLYIMDFNDTLNTVAEQEVVPLPFTVGTASKGFVQPDFPTFSQKMILLAASGAAGSELAAYGLGLRRLIDVTLNTSSFNAQKGVLTILSDASSSPDYVNIEIGNVFSPLFVRSWGDDATGDGSFSNPYKTINKASQQPGFDEYFEVDIGDLIETNSGSIDFSSHNFVFRLHPSTILNLNQILIDPSQILVFRGGTVNISEIRE